MPDRYFCRVAVLILSIPLTALAKEPRPNGRNCAIEAPPASAGEIPFMHGSGDPLVADPSKVLTYPRTKDIGSTYTGCQATWGQHDDKWKLVSLVYVEHGAAVRLWLVSLAQDRTENCRYKAGKIVVGDPSNCPNPNVLLTRSLPSGCLRKIRTLAENQSWPSECKYE